MARRCIPVSTLLLRRKLPGPQYKALADDGKTGSQRCFGNWNNLELDGIVAR
ncbi:MAG TPA: hypothetical protein VGN63_06860 [Flavisolibacter sp.]|jgi:hypothetical protein|nr:hypothetical protein [Flavisolibacter sp.]